MLNQLLPISDEFSYLYKQKILEGITFSKQSSVVFTGLVRNVANILEHNVKFLLDNDIFLSTYMVLYENDSTDNTKEILEKLKNQYSNFYYISENLNLPHLPLSKSNERTIALSNYRNICKTFIKDNLYSKIDFVSVIDLDFIDISSEGILNTFGWLSDNNIMAVSGNSFQLKNILDPNKKDLWNYDSWAFRGNWWIDKQTEPRGYDPMLWFGFWIPPVGSPLIKTNSSFGGMTTYNKSIYFNAEYEGYDCEHVCYHKNLSKLNSNFSVMLNPSQMMLFI